MTSVGTSDLHTPQWQTPEWVMSRMSTFSREGQSDHESLRKQYFFAPNGRSKRQDLGIAETPLELVSLMIDEALDATTPGERQMNSPLAEMAWLDPAVGAGAFPLELVRRTLIEASDPLAVTDLPQIEFWDIDETALLITLSGLEELLASHDMSIRQYLRSGRLRPRLGDFTAAYADAPQLAGEERSRADVVIGNPPYVRATRMRSLQRMRLRESYPSFYLGDADLYHFFFAAGLNALREGGVLTLITPATYSRSRNGSSLRALIAARTSLAAFIDLDESPAFEGVAVHTAITTLVKGATQGPVRYAHREGGDLSTIRNWQLRSLAHNAVGGFVFRATTPRRNTQRARTSMQTLARSGLVVRSGIRPGVARAFILDRTRTLEFDPEVRKQWLRPILVSKDIGKWHPKGDPHFIIWTPNGCDTPPKQILDALFPFRDALENRPERNALGDWYMLRNCNYVQEMSSAGICYPDIATTPRFSRSPEGVLVADGAYFIDTDNPVLLAILNSAQALDHFHDTCSSIGSLAAKGRFRLKTQAVLSMPVPPCWDKPSPATSRIAELVSRVTAGDASESQDQALQQEVDRLYEMEGRE